MWLGLFLPLAIFLEPDSPWSLFYVPCMEKRTVNILLNIHFYGLSKKNDSIFSFGWTIPLKPSRVQLAALHLPTSGKLSSLSPSPSLFLSRSVSGLVHLLLAGCVIMCKFCQSLKKRANAASWHTGMQNRDACPFSPSISFPSFPLPSLTSSINPIFPYAL